jgi:excisionase family DNA binding protein
VATQRVALADPLLTIYDVARMLGVHHGTVRRWISEGQLPPVKISRQCVRIRARSLQAFLVARTPRTSVSAS